MAIYYLTTLVMLNSRRKVSLPHQTAYQRVNDSNADGPKDRCILSDHFFLLTAALKPAPAENLGTVAAAILSFSPVRGLLPVRATRLATLNVPKPIN